MDLYFCRTSHFTRTCSHLFAKCICIICFYICPFAQRITCSNTSSVMCFTVVVSDNADLLQRNTTEETSQEDLKAQVVLIASSTALVTCLIFIIFCVMFIKHRIPKGNFCRMFRCSREQQRPASEAQRGVKALDMQSDSHKKGSISETVPLMSSVAGTPSISDESNHSDTPSSED